MEATTFYTNECSEAMFIQDNGQNGWNTISIRLSNPTTNDSMTMVHSLIIELFTIECLFVILISLFQLLAINIQTDSNWSIFTAFRPILLSHSHWLDIRLLFLHYWVFIHCSDHYRHVSSFNYIYILFLVIRFYIFQCFVTKTLSLLPLFPSD